MLFPAMLTGSKRLGSWSILAQSGMALDLAAGAETRVLTVEVAYVGPYLSRRFR